MPLTELQLIIARLLAKNRTLDSYLAGGAALHFAPNAKRYSDDLDYFHDSVERVASAFEAEHFITSRPPHELGALYYSKSLQKFIMPKSRDDVAIHYGTPGGIIPQFL